MRRRFSMVAAVAAAAAALGACSDDGAGVRDVSEGGSGGSASGGASGSASGSASGTAETTTTAGAPEPGLEGFCQAFIIEWTRPADDQDVDLLVELAPDDLADAAAAYAELSGNESFEASATIQDACANEGPARAELAVEGGEDDGTVVELEGGYCADVDGTFTYSYLGPHAEVDETTSERNTGHLIVRAEGATAGEEVDADPSSALANVGLATIGDSLLTESDGATLTLEDDRSGSFRFERQLLGEDEPVFVTGEFTCD